MKDIKVLVAHPGTQHARFLATELSKNKLLKKYVTSLSFHYQALHIKILKKISSGIYNKLENRIIKGIKFNELKTIVYPEISFILSKFYSKKTGEGLIYLRNKRFQEGISTKIINESDATIGFDTSSWIVAEKCKALGKKFILDVSIGHPDSKYKIYRNLSVKYPAWENDIVFKEEFLSALERKEMELADLIVVPSNFVKRTYIENGINENKIAINPFGTNVNFFTPSSAPIAEEGVSFLFFGALTARKGLPFLLETWQQLYKVYSASSLAIAGFGKLPDNYKLPCGVTNLGAINPTMRLQLYHSKDVFVFPSFFEGFAQVQIEAAACGLPIIGTENSGAEELVTNGQEGYIIQPGNKEQLYTAMEAFILDKKSIRQMGNKASIKAHKYFTWEAYGERWKNIIDKIEEQIIK